MGKKKNHFTHHLRQQRVFMVEICKLFYTVSNKKICIPSRRTTKTFINFISTSTPWHNQIKKKKILFLFVCLHTYIFIYKYILDAKGALSYFIGNIPCFLLCYAYVYLAPLNKTYLDTSQKYHGVS